MRHPSAALAGAVAKRVDARPTGKRRCARYVAPWPAPWRRFRSELMPLWWSCSSPLLTCWRKSITVSCVNQLNGAQPMDNYQTNVLDLLADLIHEQQKTRAAITDFAEALAGVKREAAPETAPAVEEKPAEPVTAPALDRSNSDPEDRTAYLAKLRKTFAAKSKIGRASCRERV